MDKRKVKLQSGIAGASVLIYDMRPEIVLDGLQLLKLEINRPGVRVTCTTGALWLTQPNDPRDHFLKAGQSLTLSAPGIILVQGLPYGKARLLESGDGPLYRAVECADPQNIP